MSQKAKPKKNKHGFYPVSVSSKDIRVTDKKPLFSPKTQENKIIYAFQNVDMRFSYNGLGFIASRAGLHPDKIPSGNWILFLNSSRTMLKLMGHGGVIVQYQSKHGRLDLNVFSHIDQAFKHDGSFDFSLAIKSYLVENLSKKGFKQEDLAA